MAALTKRVFFDEDHYTHSSEREPLEKQANMRKEIVRGFDPNTARRENKTETQEVGVRQGSANGIDDERSK